MGSHVYSEPAQRTAGNRMLYHAMPLEHIITAGLRGLEHCRGTVSASTRAGRTYPPLQTWLTPRSDGCVDWHCLTACYLGVLYQCETKVDTWSYLFYFTATKEEIPGIVLKTARRVNGRPKHKISEAQDGIFGQFWHQRWLKETVKAIKLKRPKHCKKPGATVTIRRQIR